MLFPHRHQNSLLFLVWNTSTVYDNLPLSKDIFFLVLHLKAKARKFHAVLKLTENYVRYSGWTCQRTWHHLLWRTIDYYTCVIWLQRQPTAYTALKVAHLDKADVKWTSNWKECLEESVADSNHLILSCSPRSKGRNILGKSVIENNQELPTNLQLILAQANSVTLGALFKYIQNNQNLV